MFDNIINAVKGFFPDRLIQFAVVGIVAGLLYQLVGGQGIDAMKVLHFVVEIVAAGLIASAVMGAAKG
ncbi:MAG TPA: hypothetical protein VD713_07240 [Sphingomonadales bacterium]|nr:hypothetical protein [Sphingomonadales bacterium]